ncbi:MAG: DNA-3-methyladenine glycosylase 2 family protein [Planctomycetota bacterium]|nr:DNA-3-methyladenine glycosylase 2 family protein [Planctomycetota bacterium]
MPTPNRPTPAALRALARRDPILGAAMGELAPFPGFPDTPARRRESHYQSLARAIVYQQLSGKAAATIWGRAVGLTPGSGFPKPAELLAFDEDSLRACGISRPKLRALTDLAERAHDGRLGLGAAARLDDDEVIGRLVAVRGIGVWSAQMFLMFKLGRLDVLPVGDLGVQEGLCILDGLDLRPTPDELAERGQVWRPLASVAAWFLWRLTDTPRCEKK